MKASRWSNRTSSSTNFPKSPSWQHRPQRSTEESTTASRWPSRDTLTWTPAQGVCHISGQQIKIQELFVFACFTLGYINNTDSPALNNNPVQHPISKRWGRRGFDQQSWCSLLSHSSCWMSYFCFPTRLDDKSYKQRLFEQNFAARVSNCPKIFNILFTLFLLKQCWRKRFWSLVNVKMF